MKSLNLWDLALDKKRKSETKSFSSCVDGSETFTCLRITLSLTVVRNFGVIFDAFKNMKKTTFISLIFLALGLLANGQDKSVSEFDLYGGWILDLEKTEQNKGKLIYKRSEESKTKLKEGVSAIYFQAFEECKIATYRPFICGNEVPPPDYSWTFEEDTGIVNIYSFKKWLKEFKENHPEEHEKFGSPEKFDKMRLTVVELDNGKIGLEKLRTTKPIANRAKSE